MTGVQTCALPICGAVAETDDATGEVTSQNLMVPRSEASIAAEIEDMIKTTVSEADPPIEVPAEAAAEQAPEGAIPSARDAQNP